MSGNLSSNIDRLFTSGVTELGEAGWWKLKTVQPPSTLLHQLKTMTEVKKKKEKSPIEVLEEGVSTKRKSRLSGPGSSMMNAIALKEKRDFLSPLSVKTKQKGERKRKLKDEEILKRKKRSANIVEPISAFDNLWELRKVGDRYMTVPKDAGLVDRLRLAAISRAAVGSGKSKAVLGSGKAAIGSGEAAGGSSVVISRNLTVSGHNNSKKHSVNGHAATNGNLAYKAAVEPKRKTYQRVKTSKPPSTVTDMLARARTEPPGDKEISIDLDDPFTGELRIDLSPEVADFKNETTCLESSGETFNTIVGSLSSSSIDNIPTTSPRSKSLEDHISSEGIMTATLSPEKSLAIPLSPEQDLAEPPSPDSELGEPLSPEHPVNPLVFLPQYELSHLDLGGEVELQETFTEESSSYPGLEGNEDENFMLAGVEDVSLHSEDSTEGDEMDAVADLEEGDLYADSSTAEAIMDRTSQPSLEVH